MPTSGVYLMDAKPIMTVHSADTDHCVYKKMILETSLINQLIKRATLVNLPILLPAAHQIYIH